MKSSEIRSLYLQFFKERGHAIIPSARLVPENDPTTLFTGSGMQPLVPFLLGKEHPAGTRVTDSQKCFRSGDIEEVGDNRHTTFFEMLGNWSLGDYFKKEQLPWFFEFLTEKIGIDPERLYVTAFIGDEKNNIPRDLEAADIWKELFAKKGIEAKTAAIGSEANGYEVGMNKGERIFFYDSKKNWWSRAGVPENMPAGEPGGPDSEVFYDFGTPHDQKWGEKCHPNCDCGRFLEIGNSVFMQYIKNEDGSFSKLPKQNVDFGGGLERIAMAAQHSADIIASNHKPILEHLERESGKSYGANEKETFAFRVIADHMKAAVFLAADGVSPGNVDQGYFVRRLIRRAVRYADQLGIADGAFAKVVRPIADMYKDQYPNLHEHVTDIEKAIAGEEEKFRRTLATGLKEFDKIFESLNSTDTMKTFRLDGQDLFNLYQTYGFPVELSIEEVCVRRQKARRPPPDEIIQQAWKESFAQHMKKHQELSRAGSEQKFKGGLADHSEKTTSLHTCTHLMLAGLRKYLGDHVHQAGSNITEERTRFDFTHPEKVGRDVLDKVEAYVNEAIAKKCTVVIEKMQKNEAKAAGVEGSFWEKYPDVVNVYAVKAEDGTLYSQELCGGPHVETTANIKGTFKITKEEASSAGVRRIKAILV